jgi:hypothetical protein
MRKLLLLLTLSGALAILAATGHAQFIQQRPLPEKGERGHLGEPQPLPMVQIGGRVLRLAPGGIIFDQHNRTIVHRHLPAGADIWYTRDMNGDVQRIYILTEQEQARLDKARRR